MKDTRKGILLSLVLSAVVLFIYFGPLLKDPNQIYFAPSGDGLKSYAASIYHLTDDKTLFRSSIQNYPYGEMAFFADCQPMISIPVKLLSAVGLDFRSNLVEIINLSMLLSIVVAAIFICLILMELNVSWWYGAIASVGICMLSPQIGRLPGHFSLSHMMWLPMLIWLLIQFDKKKTYLFSAIIGLITFLAAGMHMYFFAIFGFLFLFYWTYILYNKQMNIRSHVWLLHLFIQLILPLILVQILVGSNDHITDRTSHPWGFYTYTARPATVFLPIHKPYATFLKLIGVRYDYEWESFAFIGLVSLIGFIAGTVKMIQRIKRKQTWWMVSENKLLSIFFWSSIASLLLSFSIPFNMGLTFLLDYLGPIKQLRALSRFSWLFFYVLNFIVFSGIFSLIKKGISMKILALLALAFILYDGSLNIREYAAKMNNRIPELEDKANTTPENAWVLLIDKNQYQAILPLPFFHVGSENVWLESKCESLRQSLIVSLKSGLPSMGVALSRTSISQTYKSLELTSDPVSPYRIINDFPNKKPLLLIVDNCKDLNTAEKNLVRNSSMVWQGPKFAFYSLPIAQLDSIAIRGQKTFDNEMLAIHSGSIDSTKVLFFDGFENTIQESSFSGKGAYSGEIGVWNHLADVTLKNMLPGDSCEILFWAKGFEKDLFARSIFEFVQKDGEQTVEYKYDQFQRYFSSLKDGWMRIRIPFILKTANDRVLLAVQNKELKNFKIVVDDLIIQKKP